MNLVDLVPTEVLMLDKCNRHVQRQLMMPVMFCCSMLQH